MLNSTETRIQVTPWPLTPAPSIVDLTNTTITVEVVLDNQLRYEPVTNVGMQVIKALHYPSLSCLLYTSPSPRDQRGSRMPSSA